MNIPYAFVLVLFVINISFGAALYFGEKNAQTSLLGRQTEQIKLLGPFPETEELRASSLAGFDALSKYFKALTERKGAAYAFAVLLEAPMPPNIDMHLMGHVIGDVLFQQQGVDGIVVCTQDFRNACSHSIVVGALLKYGEAILPDVQKACRKAPGGKGAYTMCYHGFGHGVLAYFGYDIEKAVVFCKNTGTRKQGYQESAQCIGGAVMEMVGGGFHDPVQWREQRVKYLDPSVPLAICSASWMPEEGRHFCITYITPYLFEAAGANLAQPTVESFARAFKFCRELPEDALSERHSCFGGFGKEFVVFARGHDVRDIGSLAEEELARIVEGCGLAGDIQGERSCIKVALSSIFWGGENERFAAERFCSILPGVHQETCYKDLIDSVRIYIDDSEYHKAFCHEIPSEYQLTCREKLGVNK